MYNDLEKILFTKEELETRIGELAAKLDSDYAGKNPLMICILKGSVFFYTALLQKMTIPLELDFMAVSSYGNTTRSSGEVKIVKDLDKTVEGRDIIIVEDIVDSGFTLTYLKRLLFSRRPDSIKVCTLLDKVEKREVPFTPEYKCFDVGDEFVVGFGLDYAQQYRNLPLIGVLKKEIYSN